MKVIPLGDRLLIKVIKEEVKTSGGIVLPDSAKEKPQMAEVIEVSGDIEDKKIKKGDKVIYSKYAGTEIKLDGEEYILINLDDVLAIVED
jgi:chaperonin GroES